MKGLLLKDYYMLMKYYKTYIIIIGIMAIVTMFSTLAPLFVLYPVIMANMLTVSLIGYDEMSHFDRYYQTMPVSKAKYVSAKYLMQIIIQTLTVTLFSLAYFVSLIRNGEFKIEIFSAIITYMIIMVSVLPSILLPFVIKFGSEKGRMFYLMVTAIFVGAVMYLLNQEIIFNIDINALGFIGSLFISILVLGLSWFISLRIYTKKEIV